MNPWLLYAAATATTSLLFLAVAAGVGWRLRKNAGSVRPRIERMTCPKTGGDVFVTFLRDTKTGKALDVDGCSAFVFEDDVHCDKACMKGLNYEASKAGS